MMLTTDPRLARQADTAVRAIVILLSRTARLAPDVIDKLRTIVVASILFGEQVGNSQRAPALPPGTPAPFDDEPTSPQRPSKRPKM